MIDVAEAQGLKLDVDKLSQQLGVPIVPIQANKGRGLDALKAQIAKGWNRQASPTGRHFQKRLRRRSPVSRRRSTKKSRRS